ncbi:MAG: hypothetical protein ACTS27_12790 [Phycisphaerales bacterium]
MHDWASPKLRARLRIAFFTALCLAAAFVIFIAGMICRLAIEEFDRHSGIDCIISKIESGAIAPGTDAWGIIACAGKPDAQWYAGEIDGEQFLAHRYSDRNRWLTAYIHIAPGESGLLFAIHLEGYHNYSEGDHWFFIDRDKFDAYLDASTCGRVTRSATPGPQN